MATSFHHNLLDDYKNIRTVPAFLSVLFVVGSLYQFGGITQVELAWFSNYTLTAEHAVMASLGSFLVAFMSSQTKRFENYEEWEQAAIILGPAVILGQQYITEIDDLLVSLGDPLGYQIAFVLTIVSWGVAVR